MNLIAALNNSIVEVEPSKDRYRVHYLNGADTFLFEHIEHHGSGAMDNMAKDKEKEIGGFNGVENLLRRGIIKIVEHPPAISWGTILTEIDL